MKADLRVQASGTPTWFIVMIDRWVQASGTPTWRIDIRVQADLRVEASATPTWIMVFNRKFNVFMDFLYWCIVHPEKTSSKGLVPGYDFFEVFFNLLLLELDNDTPTEMWDWFNAFSIERNMLISSLIDAYLNGYNLSFDDIDWGNRPDGYLKKGPLSKQENTSSVRIKLT